MGRSRGTLRGPTMLLHRIITLVLWLLAGRKGEGATPAIGGFLRVFRCGTVNRMVRGKTSSRKRRAWQRCRFRRRLDHAERGDAVGAHSSPSR
jgi:hypothetical protein